MVISGRLLDTALEFAREGYPVFPLRQGKKVPIYDGGFKIATRDEDQIRAWWRDNPHANIGIPTGSASGLAILDVDPDNGGNESCKELFKDHGGKPDTPILRTPSGGIHLYFRHAEGLRNSASKIGDGLDIRGDGGYVVASGSVVDGVEYTWAVPPTSASFAPLPDWLYEKAVKPEPKKNLTTSPDGFVSEGKRNDTLVRLAGGMRKAGFSTEAIRMALIAQNEDVCVPPLSEEEVTGIADQANRWERGKAKAKDKVWIPQIITLSTIEPEDVDCRWKDRIYKGKIHIMQGDPEQGKTSLAFQIGAMVTQGLPIHPDTGEFPLQDVLYLSTEDGLADTIVPRLLSMNADLTRFHTIRSMRTEDDDDIRGLSLTTDLAVLDRMLAEKDYGLVIIDPISAYTPNTNTDKDNHVRAMLMPIAEIAERHRVPIILIRHLTKDEQKKMAYRGGGSIAYEASARVVMLVGKNPDNEEERIVAVTKNNLALHPPSLAFTLTMNENNGRVMFTWIGESEITADQLVTSRSGEEKSAMEEAQEFILDMLKDGDKLQRECIHLAKENGFSETTINRAKRKLRIRSVKPEGKQHEPWYWHLPTGQGSQDSQEIVDHVDHLAGKLNWV